MKLSADTIKKRMLEFTQLFSIERNVFQRFVIVYKYIYFLNTDPVAKSVLQKIFDETSKVMGEHSEDCLDEDQFLDVKGQAIFSRQFWIYYSNLEIIYGKMKKLKKCGVDDKLEFETLCQLFSKPYSRDMLSLSFKVVNSEIFNQLDKESFFEAEKEETWFDDKLSVLYVRSKKVLINKQDKITNAHKLLHHIFITNKNNIEDEFFYSEIADDEFGDMDYTKDQEAWKRYHRASEYVNEKICEQTDNEIRDFLVYNTGKQGRVKINKAYL